MSENNSLTFDSLTVAQLQSPLMRITCPEVAQLADLLLCGTYDRFIELLYRDIDNCIKNMEEDPKVRKQDSEDRLTEDFRTHLKARGTYIVTHDEKIGGHCDLIVRDRNQRYLWLGEAKIHSDYAWLEKGFSQLCDSYAPGTSDANQGGLIVYIRTKMAKNVLTNWKNRLIQKNLDSYSIQECPSRKELAFFSTHTHERSGLPYKVRHMAVVLFCS